MQSCLVVLEKKKGFVYVTQMKDGFWCTVGIRGHPFFGLESDLMYSVCNSLIDYSSVELISLNQIYP